MSNIARKNKTTKSAALKIPNRREPKPSLVLRLLMEAQNGKPHKVSVVNALEFRRDQYDLSQSEFSAILGMYPSHYSEFVNGKRELPVSAAKRAFAIGVPSDILLQSGEAK